jgi:hypothetical protein
LIQISSDIHGKRGSDDVKSHFDFGFDENIENQGDIATDLKELEEMIEEFSSMSEESREFAFGQLIKALGDDTEMIKYVKAIKKYVNADKNDETAAAASVSERSVK